MDYSEAQELLSNAAATDPTIPGYTPEPAAGGQEQSSSAEQSPSGVAESDAGAAGSADTNETFTAINPDDLPEQLQSGWKQLQAAFTRKTQELAEIRKTYESFGEADPRQVLEAYEFVNALQTDPRVAMQVHQELSQVLQAQGFTPQQADNMAAQRMNQDQQGFQPQDEYDMSWMDDPVQPMGVNPDVQRQLDELQQFKQSFYEMQAQQQQAMEFQRQALAIQSAHPEYGEPELEFIANLSFAHNGDMFQAEKQFSAMRDAFAASLFKDKASVPAATPAQQGPAQIPQQGFKSLDDPNLEAAVRERLAALGEL